MQSNKVQSGRLAISDYALGLNSHLKGWWEHKILIFKTIIIYLFRGKVYIDTDLKIKLDPSVWLIMAWYLFPRTALTVS